jgi:peptide/nickel transport system substrate-binding protein
MQAADPHRNGRGYFRHLTSLILSALLMSILAACGAPAPAPQIGTAPEAPSAGEAAEATVSREAPSLAARVASGDLPPLEERLPAEPMVVTPVESIGQYGGTWRSALMGGADNAWLVRTLSYEHLVRWTPDWTGVIPNIAESFEVNDDASEYTFYLREGMRWSDGAPFSADDILFWYEDVAMNEEYRAANPLGSWLRAGNEPVVVEKVDDYTVIFRFSEPSGLFLQFLAAPGGEAPSRWPKHYCSQFHPDYAEDLDELIRQNDATDWVNLMGLKCGGVPGTPYDARYFNGDLPVLWAWEITIPYGGDTTRVVAERNPYYWKVDTEGNQLPYIDRLVYDLVSDPEVLLLKVLNGEIDMSARHFNTNENKAVIVDNMEQGNYHLFDTTGSADTRTGLMFNLTHKDPRLREIFQDKNFRIGLSHAINRGEIIDLIFVGQAEPMGNAICKEMPDLYNEEMYTLYTEYDPELAQEYLAQAGITEKGSDGYYLGPDGRPLSFVVQTTDAFGFADRTELVIQQWQQFGINAQLQVIDRSLLYTRKDGNEHDVHVWSSGGCSEVFVDPRHFVPVTGESAYAMAWYNWYTNPTGTGALTQPEEPPAEVKRQMEIYNQIKATGDPETQNALMRELLEIAADQFYVIGLTSAPPGYGIVKNNFHNVPALMPGAWQYPNPAPTNPEQYWISQ